MYFGKQGVRYNCWFNCSSGYGSQPQPTVAPVHINENDPLLPRCFAQSCCSLDIRSWTKELKTDIIRPRAPKLVCMSIRHQLFDQIHCERLFGWPASLRGIVLKMKRYKFLLETMSKSAGLLNTITLSRHHVHGMVWCGPADLRW